MRRCLAALLLIGIASQAAADEFDVPTLRGSTPFIPAAPTYTRWQGFYVGGQVGRSSTEMNFQGATQALISYLLRTTALENTAMPSQWGVLGTANTNTSSFGVFAGYNSQWDDVIVGVDAHYNSGPAFANAPVAPIRRIVAAGGNVYDITVNGSASMRITDFGVARARAGWILGNFLPYMTGGFAVGRADVTRTANTFGAENPPPGYPGYPAGPAVCGPGVPPPPAAPCTEFNLSNSEGKQSAFIYGWAVGGGLDALVMPNVFLRAEYEYISFSKIMGITARMNTMRAGLGFKF
jgi:opacity protein-like surface antigen